MPSMNDVSHSFLFTFRHNGEAHGQPLAEVLVEQLADGDPSVAPDASHRSWFGTQEALCSLLPELGFEPLDVQGVVAALHDRRGADRKLAVTQAQLQAAGFQEPAWWARSGDPALR